jgi:hypothetical protein
MGARYVWINVLVGGLFAVAVDAEQRLISVSTSLTSASISVTSCGVMCSNRCDTLDGTASIGNDSELAAGGLVFTKSEDIEMLSKDLFISMKEIRVKYHFAGTRLRPTALGTEPRSATTETPVHQGRIALRHARPSLKKG